MDTFHKAIPWRICRNSYRDLKTANLQETRSRFWFMWNDVFKVSSSRINTLQLLLLKWRPQPLVVNGWGANGRPGGGKNIQFFGWLWSDLVIHVSFSNAPNFQKSKNQVFWIWPTLLRSFPLTYVFHGRTGSWYGYTPPKWMISIPKKVNNCEITIHHLVHSKPWPISHMPHGTGIFT